MERLSSFAYPVFHRVGLRMGAWAEVDNVDADALLVLLNQIPVGRFLPGLRREGLAFLPACL